MKKLTPTIAIDGPAASGKGTLARRLAAHYGFHHLDTGLTYRGVAHALLEGNMPLDNEDMACLVAEQLDLGTLNQEVLSAHEIGEAASKIAVMSGVREVLVEAQRKFANKEPGAVLDGRDIGTVVFPDAEIKIFMSASPEKRAYRRYKELLDKGEEVDYDEVLKNVQQRDAIDSSRKVSPLRKAKDAIEFDNSDMGLEEQFERMYNFALRVIEK